MLLSLAARGQVARPDTLPSAETVKSVADTLRPVIQGVLRPDELAKLENADDSIPVTIITDPGLPVPKKAAIYSLILPSLGQIYNRDYWKVPFVFAGIGGAGYMIHWNTIRYRDYLNPYLAAYDSKGNLLGDKFPVYIRGRDETLDLSIDQIKRGKTFYRRYREYGFVIMGLVYALAAVEANVAAHLKNFNANMNEDLTLKFEPSNEPTFLSQTAPGVKLSLTF